MPRPLVVRRFPPFIEVLTRHPASVLFNLALRVRLIPKTYLSIHIFSQFSCGHASLSLDYGLASLGLFPTFL
jgi:hypothetical protein